MPMSADKFLCDVKRLSAEELHHHNQLLRSELANTEWQMGCFPVGNSATGVAQRNGLLECDGVCAEKPESITPEVDGTPKYGEGSERVAAS